MIVTKLNGGLGNQLFEYACARSLQIKNNDCLFLDVEGFKRSPRHYSLEPFFIPDDVKILPESKSKKLLFLQAVSKISRNLAFKLGPLFGAYIWKSSEYRPISVPNTKHGVLYLYGYWQSEKYFHENSDIIKAELHVKTEMSEDSKMLLDDVMRDNSVCVHIRRGDYVTCGFLHCDEAYYNRGMNYIKKCNPDCNFIVFSDDISWVRNNMKFENPVKFIDANIPDYEVLRLMYLCKHFVISNSSFSWWASYLSDNENKIVVAPEYWLPENKSNRSMYLDNWIIL